MHQDEIRNAYLVTLACAAKSLLKHGGGKLAIDSDFIKKRIPKLVKARPVLDQKIADEAMGRIVHMATSIVMRQAEQQLHLHSPELASPKEVGSRIQKQTKAFEEFVVEMIIEFEPDKITIERGELRELIECISGLVNVPVNQVRTIVLELYSSALSRQMSNDAASAVQPKMTVPTVIADSDKGEDDAAESEEAEGLSQDRLRSVNEEGAATNAVLN